MPVNVAIVIAIAILSTTAMILVVLARSRKRAAKEEEIKRAASARGWQFETSNERGYRVHRWSGSTDGVAWRAESLFYPSDRRQSRPNLARWHADWQPGINGAIVCLAVPNSKQLPAAPATPNDSFLGKLAQKAVGFAFDKAIDMYFGDGPGQDVDAGALHRVDSSLPGFVVMAAQKDEGARVLSQGLEPALTSATHDPNSVFSHANPPSILLRPAGISLARIGEFSDTGEIDGFVRAGLALTRSSRFRRV